VRVADPILVTAFATSNQGTAREEAHEHKSSRGEFSDKSSLVARRSIEMKISRSLARAGIMAWPLRVPFP